MPDLRKRAIMLAASSAGSSLTTLAVAAILSRLLTKPIYATYQQAYLVYGILLGMMSLNLGASIYYFLPRSGSEQRKTIVAQSVLFGCAVGLAVGAVMFVGSPRLAQWMNNESLVPLLYLMAIYALLNQAAAATPSALVATDRINMLFWYRILISVGRAAAIVVPFAIGVPLRTVFLVVVGAEFVIAGLSLLLLRQTVGLRFRGIKWHGLREEFDFMWPLLVASLIGTLGTQFDKAIVAVAFDPARFAEYTNGAMQLPFVILFIDSIFTAVLPEMSAYAGQGKINDMMRLWQRAAVKGATLTLPLLALCLACPDYLITLLYGDAYLMSALPFAIYCLAFIVRFVPYSSVFQAMGRNRIQIFGAAGALVAGVITTLAVIYLGRRYLGPDTILAFAGPALGTMMASFTLAGYRVWQIARLTDRPAWRVLPLREIGKVGLVAVVAALVAAGVRFAPMDFRLKLVAMGIVAATLFILIGRRLEIFSPVDIAYAQARIRQVLVRLRLIRAQEPSPPKA
jgi:O-antigen/teichoic acid export membrane protein